MSLSEQHLCVLPEQKTNQPDFKLLKILKEDRRRFVSPPLTRPDIQNSLSTCLPLTFDLFLDRPEFTRPAQLHSVGFYGPEVV